MKPAQQFPLTWPMGVARTPNYKRERFSRFKVTPSAAFDGLMTELQRLGAREVIVSSNLMLRADGVPYARQPKHDDEGIAVYFKRKGVEMVFACDKFVRREDNMHAIAKSIDAIRGLERWGSTDMMERAFTGFAALPGPTVTSRSWREVLDASDPQGSYRRLRSQKHPDNGGTDAEFHEVEQAWQQYQDEVAR